jgi:hypothetical protein
MPITPNPTPTRQQRYRAKLAGDGRVAMQITVNKEAADKLRTLAEQRAEPPGRTLEHVLDVAAPAPMSPRKQARMDRRLTEVLAEVEAGERHLGSGDMRQRRRTARALGAA